MNIHIIFIGLLFLLCFCDFLSAQSDCEEQSEWAKELNATNRPILFIDNLDSNRMPVRYLNELQQLAHEQGLEFQQYIVTHEGGKSGSQVCKEHFMDSIIQQQWDAEFKSRLIAKAESLFIATVATKVVNFTYCDYWPHPHDEAEGQYKEELAEPSRSIVVPASLIKKLPVDEYGNKPSFILNFIVEKDGSLSGFNMDKDYLRSAKPLGKQTISKLFSLAKAELLKEAPWVPGLVGGNSVRAAYYVTIML